MKYEGNKNTFRRFVNFLPMKNIENANNLTKNKFKQPLNVFFKTKSNLNTAIDITFPSI